MAPHAQPGGLEGSGAISSGVGSSWQDFTHTGPADVTSFDLWQGVASWMEKSWKHALEC